MGPMLLRIALLLITAWAGAVAWMWVRQEAYLFIPNHWDPLAEFESYRWDREINGVKLQGWFLDKGADITVVFHGGNAQDMAGHCERIFAELDSNALLVNYRGYGQSEGTPGEKEIVADSIAVLDLFCKEKQVPLSSIYLLGRSIGSGVSTQVAAARPEVAGVILVTPYESIAAIARFQYPWLPIERFLRHPFRSIDYAPNLQIPALILLAEFDEVIPVESGRKLGEAWGGPKEIVTLPTGHNDINEHPDYFEAINRFVSD
ncbi:MAG: alpha/beta hydrolase [Kiritimatiellaeota bacterium]|nr:alpha/beta hydrolase [Kiritimatiellota bacterium]